MNSITCLKLLKKELEELFNEDDIRNEYETKFKDPEKNHKKLRIDTGYYTAKRTEDDLPYILLSPMGVSTNTEVSEFEVMIITAVYSKSESGWEDVISILNRILKHLRSKHYLGNNEFEILDDINITYPYDAAAFYPIWFGFMRVKFSIYNIYDEDSRHEIGV